MPPARSFSFALRLVMLCVVLAGTRSLIAEQPVRIGAETQIFVDDLLIAKKRGVVRRVHPCKKLPKPVLEPEKPWEAARVYIYGTVLYDPAAGQFRMWYMSCGVPRDKRDKRLTRSSQDLVLYATSRDGIHWDKPNLGLYEYDGSKQNNIVFDLHSPSMIFDRDEPDPAGRYKMIGCGRGTRGYGYCAAYSTDGLHWKDYPVNPILKHADTITLARNPKNGEYLAFHKIGTTHRGQRRRLVWLATSKDMQQWSAAELVMAPDQINDAAVKDEGGRYSQFYNMSVFPYGGQFLGMVTHFRYTGPPKKKGPVQSADDGPIDVQLVHSRDGRTWHRSEDRSPVIPNGPGEYDAGCILGVTNTPVIRDDEIWHYYTAINTTHGGALPEKRITIGRAAWRLDGFVSLDAGDEEAIVQTVPLQLTAEQLVVNADASRGSLAVEVLGEDGRPLPGYAREDCMELHGDDVRHVVRFKDRTGVAIDRPVRLRFHLRNASLYGFSASPLR